MTTNAQPEISVIMSIYNQWNQAQLDDAIYSILNQTFRDFEFIIYDDGSDDEVKERLHKYADEDKRIVLISDPVNHGLAYCLNSCINVAKGKYLARMDDDDVCDINRFQVQYDYLESHPEVSFVGCNAKLLDSEGVWGVRTMPERPKQKDFLKFSPYIHPTVMIRRSVFDEKIQYNAGEDTLRCEDYELFMRLWRRKHIGYNIQQELFYYREDRAAYKKRKFKYRVDEMKLRYRNFKKMKMLFPFGWIAVLRPLLAAIVPSGLILRAKRVYHKINATPMNSEEKSDDGGYVN